MLADELLLKIQLVWSFTVHTCSNFGTSSKTSFNYSRCRFSGYFKKCLPCKADGSKVVHVYTEFKLTYLHQEADVLLKFCDSLSLFSFLWCSMQCYHFFIHQDTAISTSTYVVLSFLVLLWVNHKFLFQHHWLLFHVDIVKTKFSGVSLPH